MTTVTPSVHPATCKLLPIQNRTLASKAHPDEPGVDGPEHGSVCQDGLADLVHVIHHPAELHSAEVRTDGQAGLVLIR